MIDFKGILKEILSLIVAGGSGDLVAIKAKTDNLPTDPADESDIEDAITAAHTTTDSKIDDIIAGSLFTMDFWSDPQEEVLADTNGIDQGLPAVTVADLPADTTIVRVIAMFKFRMVENDAGVANKLNGVQYIQVKETDAGGYINAIKLVDDLFTFGADGREGGDVIIGNIDVKAQVDDNDGYSFLWTAALADADSLRFNDLQTGLRIWYSL